VEKFRQDNARLRITNRQGWLLSSIGSPHKHDAEEHPLELNETLMAILNQLYHFIMYFSERSQPAIRVDQGRLTGDVIGRALAQNGSTSWFKPQRSNRAIVTATFPVIVDGRVVGIVVADQSSDAILTLTNYALNRLITLSSIAMLLSALGLLGYATYLSIRIRRLRNATENIISADGVISETFEASTARDELGDLSRSFGDMHRRLQDYTQYLRSLASKLSHELRTPLAVVQSSLDNLNSQQRLEDTRVYTQRAREGSERLGRIITALSEASRVEQSIQSSDTESFELCPVISSSIDAYQDIYPLRHFVRTLCQESCRVHGTPELIVQMLDKLVDNAVDFSPENSDIDIQLKKNKDQVQLSVCNRGPTLPEHMQNQLFDSMVSLRDTSSDKPHMGLGLYIVKLIAEAHGGHVGGHNLADGSGVEFVVYLPVAPE
jgi:dedicated sortase system histidine kinase